MVEEKKKLMFIAFIDEQNEVIEGKFKVLEISYGSYVILETFKNKITIPWHRLIKIKEVLEGGA